MNVLIINLVLSSSIDSIESPLYWGLFGTVGLCGVGNTLARGSDSGDFSRIFLELTGLCSRELECFFGLEDFGSGDSGTGEGVGAAV
jgi:hypothetical protein